MDVRPDEKMFVHATRRGCILEIWKNNESSISPYVVKRFFKPNYISSNRDMKFPRVSENVDDPYGIFQLSCSNRYIYAIYDSEPNRRSSKIAVFDWKGNPQRLYIGNKDLLAIDVDNDNTVYALAINDDDNIELISIPL